MKPVIVLTTVGSKFDVRPFARNLVEWRLAACVNIIERISSTYRWEGEVQEDTEHLLLIKTTDERVPALRDAVLAGHPYDVPEFVVLEIDEISGPYRDWLIESV